MDLSNVSRYEKRRTPDGVTEVLVSVTPHIRIMGSKEGPEIWLCEGGAYTPGGQLIPETEYPDWFFDELSKLTESALKSVGWLDKVKPMETDSPDLPRRRGRPPGTHTEINHGG